MEERMSDTEFNGLTAIANNEDAILLTAHGVSALAREAIRLRTREADLEAALRTRALEKAGDICATIERAAITIAASNIFRRIGLTPDESANAAAQLWHAAAKEAK